MVPKGPIHNFPLFRLSVPTVTTAHRRRYLRMSEGPVHLRITDVPTTTRSLLEHLSDGCIVDGQLFLFNVRLDLPQIAPLIARGVNYICQFAYTLDRDLQGLLSLL